MSTDLPPLAHQPPGANPPSSGPTTLDLMRMYVAMQKRLGPLQAELEQILALQKTVTSMLGQKLTPDDDDARFSETFPDGVSVTVLKVISERWVPVDGQSNEFWGWVFANGHAQQFCTRELKQGGVDDWRTHHKTAIMPDGELPPFIKRMRVTSPKVEVKGLAKPKATSALSKPKA